MAKYFYQYENWTDFAWRNDIVGAALGEVRHLQGKVIGQLYSLGLESKKERTLEMLTFDVVKSSEIEGEHLDDKQVRSSIARRLGVNTAGLIPSPRNVDGIVEMMLDATQKYKDPITEERLFGWHAALFPTGYNAMRKIKVAEYRSEEVRVVSGALGKEKVHYEAVPAKNVKAEMDKFLLWLNDDSVIMDAVLKAAVAHFWFIIIHPFDDGNGRIGRAITDMMLARSEDSSERFYSLSKQIQKEREAYYSALNGSQHGSDITLWLVWLLGCMKNALKETEMSTHSVLQKTEFWEKHKDTRINERQRKMINMVFDGFDDILTSSKWAKITRTSSDTALRDIQDLIAKDILEQGKAGGRSVSYRWKI